MTLPTPPNTTERRAVNRNFHDLDSLISELNTPKEIITAKPYEGSQPNQPGEPSDLNPMASGFSDPFAGGDATEQMPEEVAKLSGKTIANTIDTALGTGFSLYAKNTTPEKYQASEKQLNNLEDAWTAVAKKYNYRVEDSPWFNVILLTVAVYLPHFQEAKTDRRFAQVDERIAEMQRKAEAAESRLQALEAKEQSKTVA